MKINRKVLFIANTKDWGGEHPAMEALSKLDEELGLMNIRVSFAFSLEDGMTFLNTSPEYSAIGIYWDEENKQTEKEARELIGIIRSRSENLPIFLISRKDIFSKLPIDLIKEVKEYIYH